mmetsp:Transcript_74421/g.206661  ORF Transcript_74421/g.206661 Transcript_74421/m.206661 type:complete len:259 (-) Transcript_74421:961-1737(-)
MLCLLRRGGLGGLRLADASLLFLGLPLDRGGSRQLASAAPKLLLRRGLGCAQLRLEAVHQWLDFQSCHMGLVDVYSLASHASPPALAAERRVNEKFLYAARGRRGGLPVLRELVRRRHALRVLVLVPLAPDLRRAVLIPQQLLVVLHGLHLLGEALGQHELALLQHIRPSLLARHEPLLLLLHLPRPRDPRLLHLHEIPLRELRGVLQGRLTLLPVSGYLLRALLTALVGLGLVLEGFPPLLANDAVHTAFHVFQLSL